jgi:hypothetical protein
LRHIFSFFLDYEKALDEVKMQLLFGILKERNIINSLFTAIMKVYENNGIKIRIDLYAILIQFFR